MFDFCLGLCAWNNHYCWPGSCGNDSLTQDCACMPGFRKVSKQGVDINSGETTCQPTKQPSILTFNIVVVGHNSEQKQIIGSESNQVHAIYGNYQPSAIVFNMTSEYTIDLSNFTKPRPSYIVKFNFGISDSTIYIQRRKYNGT